MPPQEVQRQPRQDATFATANNGAQTLKNIQLFVHGLKETRTHLHGV
jgi:hypothetical protein